MDSIINVSMFSMCNCVTSSIMLHFLENKKKGADFPKSSSYSLGYGQATFTLTSVRRSPCPKRTRNSSLTCSRVLKIGRIQGIENKSKQLNVILYMSRESVVAHPSVNKCVNWFCSYQLLKQTKQGERYRSSD